MVDDGETIDGKAEFEEDGMELLPSSIALCEMRSASNPSFKSLIEIIGDEAGIFSKTAGKILIPRVDGLEIWLFDGFGCEYSLFQLSEDWQTATAFSFFGRVSNSLFVFSTLVCSVELIRAVLGEKFSNCMGV